MTKLAADSQKKLSAREIVCIAIASYSADTSGINQVFQSAPPWLQKPVTSAGLQLALPAFFKVSSNRGLCMTDLAEGRLLQRKFNDPRLDIGRGPVREDCLVRRLIHRKKVQQMDICAAPPGRAYLWTAPPVRVFSVLLLLGRLQASIRSFRP